MFGLIIKGLGGIGVSLCFTVAQAVYDVVSQRRSIPSAILNVGLSSVFHGFADAAVISSVFDIDLPLSDDRNIQISIRDLAECTAKKVMDVSTDAWLSSHRIETLPSGLTIARTAVVDIAGNRPTFEGIILPSSEQIIVPYQQLDLPTRQIILTHTALQHNRMPHRILTGSRL